MSGIVGTSHSKSKVIGESIDTAKAWIRLDVGDQSGTGVTSFNVSSLTEGGVLSSHVIIHFIKPMKTNTEYVPVITPFHPGNVSNVCVTQSGWENLTGSIAFQTGYTSGTGGQAAQTRATAVMVVVFER